MKTIPAAALLLGGLLAGAAAAAGLDHAPGDDVAVTTRGNAIAIDVLANDPGTTPRTDLRVYRQPSHGSVQVGEGRLLYTPAAGFTGRDSLAYSVKTGRSFGVATVTVDVGDALRLQGRVTERGPGAAVSARVGERRFHAKADATGAYTIDVIGLEGEMVRLESSRGEVALASIVGGFERLLAEAGKDGVLTREENNQVQVTRLSAALAYLLQLANGGAPVESEGQLAAAQGAMDLDVLLEMSAAIKLVADGTHALPKGVADTMALISDTDAYQQFVQAVRSSDPEAIDNAIAYTLSDADVVVPTDAAGMVGAKWLAPPGATGTIRVGLITGQHLALEEGGVGTYVDTVPALDTGASWVVVGGAAAVVLDTPRETEHLHYRDGADVRRVSSLGRLDFTRLVDGGASGRDLVGITYHYVQSYPDNPEYPDVVTAGTSSMLSYREGVAEIPFRADEFPADRTLQLHRPEIYGVDGSEQTNGSNYALHRFNSGGGGIVLDDAQAFTWSLAGNGRLQLVYEDGEVAELVRLVRDGAKGDGVIAAYQLPDGRSKTIYALSSVRDGSLEFTTANLARPWRSGFDISQTAYDFENFFGFYIVLDGPDQTGRQVSIYPDVGISSTPLSWDLVDGVMVARRYRNHHGWQAECTLGVDGCYLFMERRWVPVSRAGGRIYLHEELWTAVDTTGLLPLVLLSQRGNFYEIDAPPPH
ncbi:MULTISPECIES: Ig-like domain-containing protein [unclassified Luteimonas]